MGWNDVKPSDGKPQGDKPELKYAKLEERKEAYTIRILDDEPFSRWTHWIPQANSGKGLSINCPGKDCPICAIIKKEKAEKKVNKSYNSRKMHAINILNRETSQVEILDKGNGLFEALADIMDEVGDLTGYDVKLKVSGTGRDTSYTPIPLPKKPLTEAEKGMERYNFAEIYQTPTPDQVSQLMHGASLADIYGNKDEVPSEDKNDDSGVPQVDFTK